jgi:hypothetical protein
MALQFEVTDINTIPEALRGQYKQDGAVFRLDVSGVVPASRLDEFRANNIRLQQEMEKFKGVDPAKYAELQEQAQKLAEGELIKKGDVDGLVNLRVGEMKKTYETQIGDMTGKLSQAEQNLSRLLIDNVVKNEGLKAGVLPVAIDDLALRAGATFQLQNGVPVMKDSSGNVVYGRDGTTPKSIGEWVTDLRKAAPHLFQGFSGSGAGGGGKGGAGADVSKMTPAQKISFGLANNGLVSPQQAGLTG